MCVHNFAGFFIEATGENKIFIRSLDELVKDSKLIILDFWASWCKPCRSENPKLVLIFNKFKRQGLNIISLSADNSIEQWKNAIIKDRLSWINLHDNKQFVAEHYGVYKLPTTFLLDSTKKIIAIDIYGLELENIIKKHLTL